MTVTREIGDRIQKLARGCHAVNQLVCVKLIWGPQSDIGVVIDSHGTAKTIRCNTIMDLVLAGFARPKWLWMDKYLPRFPKRPKHLIPHGVS